MPWIGRPLGGKVFSKKPEKTTVYQNAALNGSQVLLMWATLNIVPNACQYTPRNTQV